MSATEELTYAQVAEHKSKKDLYIVVHDKVYNSTSFIDEHPGGEEVLLDVGGEDATEAFEDVGHSDEAREILEGMLVGKLKRVEGDPAPKVQPPSISGSAVGGKSESSGMGVGMYAVVLVGVALAFGAYKYTQASAQDGK